MDFFAQQDLARRNTRWLVVLFLLAVLGLVLLTNVFVAAFMFFSQDYNIYSGSREGLPGFLSYFSWAQFGTIGLAISSTIAIVVLVMWIHLSTGGKAVAEGMGGTRILPQSRDAAERRCLNVVDEMALAANMPVPPVYVLNDERGINAFAAGITPADAVVAVTRGAIEHLKRDELQGVIAHEFSHILNGDMRLNIRLAAALKGITFIGDVGHLLLRSGTRIRSGDSRRSDNVLPLLGLALWLLGLIGGLAAGFIKAAISRQKEYLADASAVQFTRSADGIGSALKVIGGYIPGTLVHAARATEMSHIFFGQITHRLWQVFATHPPLRERILRIDPRWDGQYIKRKPSRYNWQQGSTSSAEVGVGRAALVAASIAGALAEVPEADADADADFEPDPDQLERETAERQDIPLVFVQHSHDPLGAQALVFALLVDEEPALHRAQLDIIAGTDIAGLELLTHTLHPGVHALGAPHRLPLLELCLPALKVMSAPQYKTFKRCLLQLIQADRRIALHEWCLYQLVRHYLDPEFIRKKPSRARYRKLQQVVSPVRTVLSLLAHSGSGNSETVFRMGADTLGFTELTLLPLEDCSITAFSRAVHTLADCYPLLKPRVLKAMTQAAGSDGVLSAVEWEIIASIAAVMDCPQPAPTK
ncbi:MAG: M48 family metallopeptidase [Halioglobus sp.]|nr:M48 family metallopeptidase [Halioglobus sp.]